MIEITLKDKKSKIYIDEFEKPTEQDRCYIYDSDKRYLDYYYAEDKSEDDYNEYVKFLESKQDGFDIFDMLCLNNSYDYSDISAQNVMLTYIDDIIAGHDLESIKDEIKDILFDIKMLDEDEFCNTYDINRIGDIYFRGNW